jgi:hypothetical protein
MELPYMPPLALSDEEMNTIFRLAGPLHPHDRGPFLETVAERLRSVEILGPGVVTRVAAETQPQFYRAPELEPKRMPTRWAR